MIYLLDSCCLINAHRFDFPPEDDAHFWVWLAERAREGLVKVPGAVFDELSGSTDELARWMQQNKDDLVLPKEQSLAEISTVLEAYSNGEMLQNKDVEKLGSIADPYIISQAIADGGTVITEEKPKPTAVAPRNKKIPDVCLCLDVPCIRLNRFLWDVLK